MVSQRGTAARRTADMHTLGGSPFGRGVAPDQDVLCGRHGSIGPCARTHGCMLALVPVHDGGPPPQSPALFVLLAVAVGGQRPASAAGAAGTLVVSLAPGSGGNGARGWYGRWPCAGPRSPGVPGVWPWLASAGPRDGGQWRHRRYHGGGVGLALRNRSDRREAVPLGVQAPGTGSVITGHARALAASFT